MHKLSGLNLWCNKCKLEIKHLYLCICLKAINIWNTLAGYYWFVIGPIMKNVIDYFRNFILEMFYFQI